MQIEVTSEAAGVLAEILERALGDTREEVYKADAVELKDQFRAREEIIRSLLQQVRAPAS